MANLINFGYVPSNGDYRNINIVNFIQTPKLQLAASINSGDQYIIDTSEVPVFSQQQLSCCAAISTTTACQIAHCVQKPGINFQPLSYLFTYYCARVPEKSIGKDTGSYIADNLESLRTIGACPQSLWADHSKVFDTPNVMCFKAASDNKISTFHNISSSGQDLLNDINITLRANRPIVFGTAVSQDFCDYSGGDKVFNYPEQKDIVGYHAMIIIGVRNINNRINFMLRNSWGKEWGLDGCVWVDQDLILKSSDFFVLEAFPDLLV